MSWCYVGCAQYNSTKNETMFNQPDKMMRRKNSFFQLCVFINLKNPNAVHQLNEDQQRLTQPTPFFYATNRVQSFYFFAIKEADADTAVQVHCCFPSFDTYIYLSSHRRTYASLQATIPKIFYFLPIQAYLIQS